MDLRGNNITLGELLDNPRAVAVLRQRFGKWMKHPLVAAGRSLTLAQLMELAGTCVPQTIIRQTWEELNRL